MSTRRKKADLIITWQWDDLFDGSKLNPLCSLLAVIRSLVVRYCKSTEEEEQSVITLLLSIARWSLHGHDLCTSGEQKNTQDECDETCDAVKTDDDRVGGCGAGRGGCSDPHRWAVS